MEAAEKLKYNKSLVASGLKGKSRKMLTLLIPRISNMYYGRIALAIEHYAFERGYIVHICNTLESPDREKAIIDQTIRQRVDGLILVGTQQLYDNTAALRAYGIPYVAIDRPVFDLSYNKSNCYFVGSDNYQSGHLAVRHLAENGHKRFCYFEWIHPPTNLADRRKGIEEAFRDLQEADAGCLVKSSGVLSTEKGYQLTKQVLDTQPLPTAFIYGHHIFAEGGIKCLRESGLNIPEDVSVMIIGIAQWMEPLTPPRFTYISQPADKIGRTAAKMLINLIEGDCFDPTASPEQLMFDCELICGDTVKRLNNG